MHRLKVISGHVSPYEKNAVQEQVILNLCRGHPKSPADYFDFDDMLTEKEVQTRYKVRQFMEKTVQPIMCKFVEEGQFPFHVLPELYNIGVHGDIFDDEATSTMERAVILMEMARVDASFAIMWMVHSAIGLMGIKLCGSEEQKKKYLPSLSRYESIAAFALTEPTVGSDASNILTTATKTNNGWLLNGEKKWIGNASHNAIIVVWAKNNTNGQINGFVVQNNKNVKVEGLTVKVISEKISLRSVQNCHITFSNVFVSEEDRLPLATDFRTGPSKVLAFSRLFTGIIPIGMCMSVYESSLKYLKDREQFGVKLASFQLVQSKLVQILANTQNMFLLAYRGIQLMDKGKITHGQTSLIKSQNTKLGRECVALARELFGGNGIDRKYGVATHFVDMEAIYTLEGTFDANILIVGREITGQSAIKKGK
ncbi:acyl-CoA oxidase [Acrasis kona]|uniref:Acyl-CoA oxidase n=1 Tax=Acrasis kona TaxID=1008807 RepID=A0AAW2ZLU8_9EUKA